MTQNKKPTQAQMMEQMMQAMNSMSQMVMTNMQQQQQQFANQPMNQFGGTIITPKQQAEIDAHNAKIAEEVERINQGIRDEVKKLGQVDAAADLLDAIGLDWEGKASFASNAMYNARRSAYSIRAGVERQEEYLERNRRAPVANPALAQAVTVQSQQQEMDVMARLDKAETQKYVYFTFEAILIESLSHLQAIVDQNERQGMASMESDSDTQFVSQSTLDFLCNTPQMSEPDYIAWREDQEKRREQTRARETAASRHTIRATTALHTRARA